MEVILLTDCLVALLVSGEIENHPVLSAPPSSPLRAQALDRFVLEPDRILGCGRDAVLRSRVPLEQAIAICVKNTPNATPESASSATPQPPSQNQESDPLALPELAEDAMQAAKQLADFWERQLAGNTPESINRIAIILDAHGKALASRPAALFLSWQFVLSSPWSSRQPAGLEEGCLHLTRDEPDSFMVRCMGGIAKLPEHCGFLKVFALSQLPPLFEKASGLRMLALALALKARQGDHRRIVLKALLGRADFDEPSIAKEVRDLAESSIASSPLEAFHTLRYLASSANVHDGEFRTHLLSAALAIPNTKGRAVALAQSSNILRFFAEGETASKSLLHIVPELADDGDGSELLSFAGLQSGDAGKAHPNSMLMAAWKALTDLATELQVDPVCALDLIGTRSAGENAELLFYYLRYLFVCENDDREYSMTVVLDTVGKRLSMPPVVLVPALARCVHLAKELNWESAALLPSGWDEEKTVVRKTFNSLLFLWSLPDGFDFLAAWGLSRIASYICLTLTDLVPLAAALASRIKESFRSLAFAGLDERWHSYSPQDLAETVRSESLEIADPFLRFHTLRILRRTGVSGISGAALLNAAAEIGAQLKREAALRDFVAEFGDAIFTENIEHQFSIVLNVCEPELRHFLIFLLALMAPSDMPEAEAAGGGGASPKWGMLQVVLRKTTTKEDENSRRDSQHQAIQWLESCASSLEQAEQRTGIAVALVCLRCSAIVPWLATRHKESLWRQLADSAQRSEAIGALVTEGRTGELELGSEAIETLTEWLARGESTEILEPVLALVSRTTQGATPLLEEWYRQYPESAIGRWACVMLAERNRWSVALVKSLTELLQYDGDLLRNRAAMAMRFRDGARGLARSSVIGRDVVLELAEITDQSDTLPHGVMLTAVWAFEVLTIDTPGLLTNLRDSYKSGTCFSAQLLFRLISHASDAVSEEVVTILGNELEAPLRAALTRGVISLWTKSWRYQAKQAKFVADVRRVLWATLENADPKVCRYAMDAIGLMSDDEEIRNIAILARQKSPQRANHLRMLAANVLQDTSYAAQLLKTDVTLLQKLTRAIRRSGKRSSDSRCYISASLSNSPSRYTRSYAERQSISRSLLWFRGLLLRR